MSHLPECLDVAMENEGYGCVCHILRAAYQRGRDDAAETVRIVAYKLLMQNMVNGITWEQMADVAIAAARGGDK